MTYQEKISVLMEGARRALDLNGQQDAALEKALVDGFLRIVQAEALEGHAEKLLHPEYCPVCGEILPPDGVCYCQRTHFPVMPVLEGYGFWVNGGYDPHAHRGRFQLAAGPDGGPLKEIARMREANGRHALDIVYPGCYIISAICPQMPEIYVRTYRILTISRESQEAICEMVTEQGMSASSWLALWSAQDIARGGAIAANCMKNHFAWTAASPAEVYGEERSGAAGKAAGKPAERRAE